MTKQTEAMKLALEALEEPHPGVRTSFTDALTYREKVKQAITALREALAEQPTQQEPVAWTLLLVGAHNGLVGKAGDKFVGHPKHYERVDVYTSPPASKPLTETEIRTLRCDLAGTLDVQYVTFARAIEAKLKEKNT